MKEYNLILILIQKSSQLMQYSSRNHDERATYKMTIAALVVVRCTSPADIHPKARTNKSNLQIHVIIFKAKTKGNLKPRTEYLDLFFSVRLIQKPTDLLKN